VPPFPIFHADIHWQRADGDVVDDVQDLSRYARGHRLRHRAHGPQDSFENVDAMRVQDGKITEHWGVANLFSLLQQLGAWPRRMRSVAERTTMKDHAGVAAGAIRLALDAVVAGTSQYLRSGLARCSWSFTPLPSIQAT
jgi:hypothetical protein